MRRAALLQGPACTLAGSLTWGRWGEAEEAGGEDGGGGHRVTQLEKGQAGR